jgi:hypothetical protein
MPWHRWRHQTLLRLEGRKQPSPLPTTDRTPASCSVGADSAPVLPCTEHPCLHRGCTCSSGICGSLVKERRDTIDGPGSTVVLPGWLPRTSQYTGLRLDGGELASIFTGSSPYSSMRLCQVEWPMRSLGRKNREPRGSTRNSLSKTWMTVGLMRCPGVARGYRS